MLIASPPPVFTLVAVVLWLVAVVLWLVGVVFWLVAVFAIFVAVVPCVLTFALPGIVTTRCVPPVGAVCIKSIKC